MSRFILIFSFTLSFAGWSQEGILEWQQQHPEMLLMTESTYQNLSPAIKTNLEGRVVIYKGKPELDDLEAYSPVQLKTNQETATPSEDDAQFVKNWLGTHPHVKIVPRSVYDASDSESQQAYLAAGALILAAEKITAADIHNYQP